MGALWVLFAAALDTRVTRAVCDGGLLSYGTLAASDRYLHSSSIMLPEVLKHFDLPQVAAAVGGRRLVLLDPVDAMKSPVDPAIARRTFDRSAEIARRAKDQPLPQQYLRLLS
jgi:hypothetical protein